jgi:hypothetical protein
MYCSWSQKASHSAQLEDAMNLREKSTAGFWAVGIHGTKRSPCKPFASDKFTNSNLLIWWCKFLVSTFLELLLKENEVFMTCIYLQQLYK